jgi:DNA-binding HxlR family transcriptional regulator
MTPAKRQFVIYNFLEVEGPMNIRQLGAKTGIDQTTLGLDLSALERAKVVKRKKVARPGPKTPAFQWSIA